MRFLLKVSLIILVSTFMWGCSTQPKVNPHDAGPPSDVSRAGSPYSETGKASFYADKHQSKKTASGDIFDQKLNTAAHKTLPFGVMVKVTNIENGKSVVVKINDRGPFVRSRIIDLSKSAFDSIADKSSGIINVKIELLSDAQP